MAETLEERVAYLEGKVEEQSRLGSDVREQMIHLDQRLGSRIDALDQKVDRFREELLGANAATNNRIDALDQRLSSRLDATNDRIDALDQRLSSRLDALDQRLSSRLDALDQKLSTQFRWLVGIMVAVLLAVIGVLLRSGPG